MSRRLHIGVFEDEGGLRAAIRRSRALGLEVHDAYTPYPVHGLEEAMGLRHSRLPIVCFAAGATGLAFALWLQYWTAATDWPLNVGGKPLDSLPAFVPVAFELLVLFAGLATAFFLVVRSRLYPGKRERLWAERLTDDRFALVLEGRDASLPPEAWAQLWQSCGAVESREELVD